jgi:hypothetical protein
MKIESGAFVVKASYDTDTVDIFGVEFNPV